MNLDLVDATEAVSVEELDEVPDGARTGHFPQALYRARVLELGVGGVSRGFLRYSGAVQRARLQQNPRARVIVQIFPPDIKKSVPESHRKSLEGGKNNNLMEQLRIQSLRVSKLQLRNSRPFFNTGKQQTHERKFSTEGVSKEKTGKFQIHIQ